MSYAHEDDKYEHVTRFYERLSHEVGVYIGEEFLIFRDREEILLGQSWKERIEESLDEVTFLIPIITPRFFNSSACRRELQRFLEREEKLKRDDLILPVYFIDCPLMNEAEKRAGNELAQAILKHQYADWRELRHEPFTSLQVGKTLEKLAVQIRDALERVQASPKPEVSKPNADVTRRQGDGASVSLPQDVESVIERGELVRGPFSKTEPPTRVLDDVFKFYRTEFVPAYSDLVGYLGDKPHQISIELENTFAHIAQYFNPELDTQDKDKNLAKAYDHLVRATLDCYKLLWVTIYEQLDETGKYRSKRKLGFNISKTEFRTKLQKLRKLAQEARRIEMASAGLSPITALDKYKGVVKDGYELIDTIDENKK